MSRHRFVKQLNLADELDDDAFSDEDAGDDYDMDDEQRAQMESSLESLQAMLGPDTPISEAQMKDALWNFYFDIEQSVTFLLDEQHKKEQQELKRKEAAQRKKAASSAPSSGRSTPATPGSPALGGSPKKKQPPFASQPKKTSSQPLQSPTITSLQSNMDGLGLHSPGLSEDSPGSTRPPSPEPATKRVDLESIVQQVQKRDKEGKPSLSLVVVGHVDAGKSTLMGKLLHELGELEDRAYQNNQRQSAKLGKGSFAYAWTFDAMPEERERGVTIDIAIDSFETEHRKFTLIDAPGHRDFIPNMINGATQADSALLVVDAYPGAFEAGFGDGGQTREHALLVRSLGVQQLVVAVNKLDAVGWDAGRYESIVEQLKPFLVGTVGFQASKLSFVPCGAMVGENIASRRAEDLKSWYDGPTLLEQLDGLTVPARAMQSPLRFPVHNVFKSSTGGPSGLGVSGRLESGIIQVGDKLAVLPGDEHATVKNLEVDLERVPWAVAGQSITAYLTNIDPIYLSPGCVLCPPDQLLPLTSTFLAQIIVFDLDVPITNGCSVELFHHSKDTSATITSLQCTLDKSSGQTLRNKPRMLHSGSSAKVVLQLRMNPSTGNRPQLPLEPFSVNKNMGRVLLRRNGETIAAGVVLEVL